VIAVKIRHADDADPAPLTEVFDVTEIDVLRRSLVGWGIQDVDDVDSRLAGQWVVYGGLAFFEFVIEDDE
jgi:hypothetical protein